MKKLLLILICSIFFISLISAAPPFIQQGAFTEGYEIKFPPLFTAKQNTDFNINIHVYNQSNGIPIDNSSTSCSLHLYNSLGNQQLESIIPHSTEPTANNEWEINIDGGNFTEVGSYAYVIQCNSSSYGGFESVGFEVTSTGTDFSVEKSILYLGLFSILIFLFIINIGVIPFLPQKNERDDDGKIIDINWLAYLKPILYVTAYLLIVAIIFAGSNLAYAYLGSSFFGELLFKLYYIMIVMMLPMTTIWFIWLFYSIFQDKKLKKALERGFE